MNLVDKDDILKDIEYIQKSPWFNDGHGAPSNERYFIRKEAVEIVRDMCVKVAPIVDAIPVEWIFEQMQILHELYNKNEHVLQWLIEMWQKEQEAR